MEEGKMRGQKYGWGMGQVVIMLVVVACLIFLPLGMAPGPVQPPSPYIFLILPVLMAVILVYLSHASKFH